MPGLTPPPYLPGVHSGDVIVRATFPAEVNRDLICATVQEVLLELGIEDGPPAVTRLIQSRTWAEIEALEFAAAATVLRPLVSLNSYYRIWLRDRPGLAPRVAAALNRPDVYPAIALAWAELVVVPASSPDDDPLYAAQAYLQDAPTGVGVRALWRQVAGSDGDGVTLIDLEHGWNRDHEDLKRHHIPRPLAGDDLGDKPSADPGVQYRVNHGTATLGVVAAVDNKTGGIGIAHNLDRVLVTSAYDRATGTFEHVASAIAGVIGRVPGWSVLLLEVQRDRYPTEVDDADFHAIRLAVASGLVVVEPAGNGGVDLDALGTPSGFLRPSSPHYGGESGAILVGAAEPGTWARRPDSNYGERVDLYAQGRDVATLGGRLDPGGVVVYSSADPAKSVRQDYGRTSAAAAIVAGVACSALGVERARGGAPPWPLDVRAALRRLGVGGGPGAADVGPRPNLAMLATGPLVPRPGPRMLRSVTPRPPGFYGLYVSNPQLPDGVMGLRQPGGPLLGEIWIPPAAPGLPRALPGAPPISYTTWLEHWVGAFGPVWSAGGDLQIEHIRDWDPANPWTPAVQATLIAQYSGVYKQVSYQYVDPPATTTPGVGVRYHYDVLVGAGPNPPRRGELRRYVDGATVRDRWVFDDTYRLPGPGAPLQLVRIPAADPRNTMTDAQWIAGIYARFGAKVSPYPTWFVDVTC